MLRWQWDGEYWTAFGNPWPEAPGIRSAFVIRMTESGYFEVSRDGRVLVTETSLYLAKCQAEKCNVRSDYVMKKTDDTARLKALVKLVREILAKALQDTAPFDTLDTISSELNQIHALLLEEENR